MILLVELMLCCMHWCRLLSGVVWCAVSPHHVQLSAYDAAQPPSGECKFLWCLCTACCWECRLLEMRLACLNRQWQILATAAHRY